MSDATMHDAPVPVKPRRKRAPNKNSHPRIGSLNDKLSKLRVGDYHYTECRNLKHSKEVKANIQHYRDKPDSMDGMRFSTRAFNASSNIGEFTILLRIERIQ